ncbi:AOFA-like protein [Mya arenaria]|uniref:Amine oxidase n=1 Tax=Mya arenaria TaxID=6604 RepID=A0ABY7FZM2_MYAAR|nr:AOFA-like protein [Mya arenaria]
MKSNLGILVCLLCLAAYAAAKPYVTKDHLQDKKASSNYGMFLSKVSEMTGIARSRLNVPFLQKLFHEQFTSKNKHFQPENELPSETETNWLGDILCALVQSEKDCEKVAILQIYLKAVEYDDTNQPKTKHKYSPAEKTLDNCFDSTEKSIFTFEILSYLSPPVVEVAPSHFVSSMRTIKNLKKYYAKNRVYRLARELDLSVYKVNYKQKSVMDIRKCWGEFMGTVPPFWNPIKLLDLNNFIRTFDAMAEEVPLEAPWSAPKAEKWDRMTVAQFVDKIIWTRSCKELADIFFRSILCVEMYEISLLFALWYVRSGGGVLRIGSVTNGAQERKIKGGTQQISQGLAKLLEREVKLSCPVVKVSHGEKGASVMDSHGNVYKCKYVISAVPVTLLNRMEFEPPLPSKYMQLIQRMPMGSIIKTVMFYKKPFWRDKVYCLDDTKPGQEHPAIMGFILARHARALAQASKEVRKESLCAYYARVFDCEEFLHPVGYMEKNWMEDQYSGGCYCAVLPPGVLTTYSSCLQDRCDCLYFAGTETATQWAGYMEGAVQAGERAANQLEGGDVLQMVQMEIRC